VNRPMKRCSVGGIRRETSLGDALKGFLRSNGLEALLKYPKLTRKWREVVGPEVAAQSRVQAFRHGVVEIAVASSSLKNDLAFSRRSILSRLKREIKKPYISGISFIVKPIQESDDQET